MTDRECVMAIAKVFSPVCYMNDETWDAAEAVLREYRAEEVLRLQAIINVMADWIAAAHEVIAKRAEKDDRHELVALISVLWLHAAPSVRHNDIREKVACVLSTAGNVRREEKPT